VPDSDPSASLLYGTRLVASSTALRSLPSRCRHILASVSLSPAQPIIADRASASIEIQTAVIRRSDFRDALAQENGRSLLFGRRDAFRL